ncbi:hypothetical protein GUITHDRAFT_114987 [Guillardia theta CCMP2712]|uniref:Uncharacterized protein n=1 Tax=Guillardia theta (strain CCMP2712) TaxID=905079 RepID=L1IRI9_GUITC|nr:hypothetical protein GUITHDRAFT_114987 [Guillardia theta CCMP2712]EKX38881.1 hypothetical protein GUITHDRAFT_114987 [Guillardia theta CCMP2712]|eukprot:XP_005825861.1 hypothetical protein GUITHDRAFT_114987 [Guillardia theta CCMP2712]
MNDSYADVKENSKLEWMVEMYHMAKEYRTPSRLNVLLLLYDVLTFIVVKPDIDKRLKQLLGEQQNSLLRKAEDLLFKFKKFQQRDIPCVDLHEKQKELERVLARKESELERREREQLENKLSSFKLRRRFGHSPLSLPSLWPTWFSKKGLECKSIAELRSELQVLARQQKQDAEELRRSAKFISLAQARYLRRTSQKDK